MSQRKRILKYVSDNPRSTEDDIAEALNLDVITVLDVLHGLEREGVLKSEESPLTGFEEPRLYYLTRLGAA
jgi:DNA-binding Lrp family transcriptional regulator